MKVDNPEYTTSVKQLPCDTCKGYGKVYGESRSNPSTLLLQWGEVDCDTCKGVGFRCAIKETHKHIGNGWYIKLTETNNKTQEERS